MKLTFEVDFKDQTVAIEEVEEQPKTHNAYTLISSDCEIIQRALEHYRSFIGDAIRVADRHGLDASEMAHEHFDSARVLSMVNGATSLVSVIPKEDLEKNWSMIHGVDFPSPYNEDFEDYNSDLVQEVEGAEERQGVMKRRNS